MKKITHQMLLEAAQNLANILGWTMVAVSNGFQWNLTDSVVPGGEYAFFKDDPDIILERGFVWETPSIYVSSEGPDMPIHFVFRKEIKPTYKYDGFVIRVKDGFIYEAGVGDKRIKKGSREEFTKTLMFLMEQIRER